MAQTDDVVRAANRATLRAAVMYACVIDACIWGYLAPPPVPPQDIVEELAREYERRRISTRRLRRQARIARRQAARLDLPEQIW